MNTNSRSDYIKGALMTTSGGICWGLSGTMGQYMFNDLGMDSQWLVPIRLGFAGIILLVYGLIKDRHLVFQPWRDVREIRDLIVYGILGVSLCQFTYFLAIQMSTASMATILQDMSPLIMLAFTCTTQHRGPKAREILAVALALGGVFLISTHGSLTNMVVSPATILVGFISATCVVVYNVTPGRLMAKYPVYLLQGWAFLMGSIVIALIFQSWNIHYVPNAIGLFGIFFVVVVGNVLAFTLYMQGVRYVGPDKGILYGFAEPITAAILGVLIFHNAFTLWDLAGFIMVFTMLALISKK